MIKLSAPLVAGNLLQTCLQTVEIGIVGKYIGTTAQAAFSVSLIVYTLYTMVALGLSCGGTIVIAQYSGAHRQDLTKSLIGLLFIIMMGTSLVISAIGIVLRRLFLNILSAEIGATEIATKYLLPACIAIIFYSLNSFIYSVFRGLGNSKIPMLLIAGQVVINLLFDMINLLAFKWSLVGIGLAMLLSQLVVCIAGAMYLIKELKSMNLLDLPVIKRRKISERKAKIIIGQKEAAKTVTATLLRVSAPIIIFGILMSAGAFFINGNVNIYGAAATSADGICSQLKNVVNGIFTGIYSGGAIIIAQSYGGNDISHIRMTYAVTIKISLLICTVLALPLLIWPEAVFSIMTNDTGVIAHARASLFALTISYVGTSLATGAFAIIEGTGKTTLELMGGILENFVMKILLGYILGKSLGLTGYWIGCAASSFAMPVIGRLYLQQLRKYHWKNKRI